MSTLTRSVWEFQVFTSLSTLDTNFLFDILGHVYCHLIVVLIVIFLITNEVVYFFIFVLVILISYLLKQPICLLSFLFCNNYLCSRYWSVFQLYVLRIFSHSLACFFIPLLMFLKKTFNFESSTLTESCKNSRIPGTLHSTYSNVNILHSWKN